MQLDCSCLAVGLQLPSRWTNRLWEIDCGEIGFRENDCGGNRFLEIRVPNLDGESTFFFRSENRLLESTLVRFGHIWSDLVRFGQYLALQLDCSWIAVALQLPRSWIAVGKSIVGKIDLGKFDLWTWMLDTQFVFGSKIDF